MKKKVARTTRSGKVTKPLQVKTPARMLSRQRDVKDGKTAPGHANFHDQALEHSRDLTKLVSEVKAILPQFSDDFCVKL